MIKMKYFVPGYILFYKNDGVLYIKSELLRNEIKITEPTLQEEFYVVQRNGCYELNTPLKNFFASTRNVAF